MKVHVVVLLILVALGLLPGAADARVGRLDGPRAKPIPAVWKRLARCETGGNWKHRTQSYQGGLGFYYASWDAYRPRRFPSEAYLATPEQQIEVGKRIKRAVGWGAWPACSIRLGLR